MPAEKTVLMLPTEDPQDALLDDDALIKSVRDAIGPLRNRLGARIEVLLPDRKRVKVQQGQLRKEFKEREGMLDAEMRFVDRRIKSLNNAYASITNGKLYTNKRNRPGWPSKIRTCHRRMAHRTVEWGPQVPERALQCGSETSPNGCDSLQTSRTPGTLPWGNAHRCPTSFPLELGIGKVERATHLIQFR